MALVEVKLCVLGVSRSYKNIWLSFVAIIQEAGVGKTCLVHRFVTDKFDDNSIPTVG